MKAKRRAESGGLTLKEKESTGSNSRWSWNTHTTLLSDA